MWLKSTIEYLLNIPPPQKTMDFKYHGQTDGEKIEKYHLITNY